MALAAGTRLGPYEILEPLGAGGMGEVYRARDTRLDRTVAVKVLPAELAADPQLKARFEREAKAISALAHPNICTLHDVGEEDGQTFLVMEHLVGQTLAERLEKGALPLDQALEIATQVADALSAAHKQGIVHRDLKPANVMLTKTGARLLDFGLARLTGHGEHPAVESLTSAPTEPEPLTGRGTVMGTLPYMAPEQIEGKPADARADLWALGAILYEMVAGHRAFEASSPVSLVGAILEREPAPLKERQPLTPPSLERLVRRCLAKDPDDRWDTAHDVADELRWVAEIGGQAWAPAAAPPRARHTVVWALSVVVAAALGALVTSWVGRSGRSESAVAAAPFHAVIELPDDIPLAIGERPQMGSGPSVAVSPDGSKVVYVGESDKSQKLYLRPMDSYEVTPIPGTEGGARPFFSPDGRWVGFLTIHKVKKVSLQGGAPLTLCDARSPVRARWTRDDVIFFVDNQGTSVSRVPAAGGVPVALQPSQGLIARVSQVLPGGKWALQSFPDGISSDHASIRLTSLDTGEARELVKSGFDARYIPTGHLIFARSGNLLAVAFDLDRLQVVGEAVPVVSNVSMEPLTGAAQQVAESANGTLVYVPGGDSSVGKLAWVDRQGTTAFLPVAERQYGAVDLAPGDERLAVFRRRAAAPRGQEHSATGSDEAPCDPELVRGAGASRPSGLSTVTIGQAVSPLLDPRRARRRGLGGVHRAEDAHMGRWNHPCLSQQDRPIAPNAPCSSSPSKATFRPVDVSVPSTS